ncbi:MAG: MerR family transcriptional regulator [Clostridia bacterium]|nr:MerR family transcriptional regulator [Clostridia bacterium]
MSETFSITETAEKFGLKASALRYYDKEGLLPGVVRTSGGVRRFTRETLRALHLITCLKTSGLSIDQIREFMSLAGREDTVPLRRTIFERQRQAVRDQIAELEDTLKLLNYKCWYYEKAAELGSESAVGDIPESEIPEAIRDIPKQIWRMPGEKEKKGAPVER